MYNNNYILLLNLYYILQSGRTPLQEASLNSDEETVEKLINATADVNIVDKVGYYQTLLCNSTPIIIMLVN